MALTTVQVQAALAPINAALRAINTELAATAPALTLVQLQALQPRLDAQRVALTAINTPTGNVDAADLPLLDPATVLLQGLHLTLAARIVAATPATTSASGGVARFVGNLFLILLAAVLIAAAGAAIFTVGAYAYNNTSFAAKPADPLTFEEKVPSKKDWKADDFLSVLKGKKAGVDTETGLDIKALSPDKGWVLAINDGMSPLWRPIRTTGPQDWKDLGMGGTAPTEIRVTLMADPHLCDGVVRKDSTRVQKIAVK